MSQEPLKIEAYISSVCSFLTLPVETPSNLCPVHGKAIWNANGGFVTHLFLLLATSASDSLVRTIQFCSVVFGVTSSLAVIHTIYRDCV